MRGASALLAVMLAAAAATAQQPATRAWQQRLQMDIPLAVPVVELEAVNPLARPLTTPPRLLSSAAPRKVEVSGQAVVAAYVDSKGDCLGSVPLELPFPGMTAELVEELSRARFEPSRIGSAAAPSWVVLEVVMEGKVKESDPAPPQLELPDPGRPPVRHLPDRVIPSGNLQRLPTTPPQDLTTLATPRRLKVSAHGGDVNVLANALVHVTEAGRCDRFVPLELPAGLDEWLSAYLATWRLDPALLDGTPVDTWIVYTGRVQMKLSNLQSSSVRTMPGRSYDPLAEAAEVPNRPTGLSVSRLDAAPGDAGGGLER
jgi:hypothetical protein